ncbi:hypothetical protein [Aestuariispira ectoiniformans]|uniref:hypothetical protein n=1 Tax=Aestuariispira ectoiniformans TaxID=2775080 RepID=UPI00223C3AC4|nr:hypothetical protein [Aestuariispira ectoiniformans]
MSRHGHHGCESHGCGQHREQKFTRRLARRLGISRKWVIGGFVILAIVNFPLAVLVFALAWFWLNKPHVVEKAGEKISSFGRKARGRSEAETEAPYHQAQDAATDGPSHFNPEADPWFQDLRRRFKDLEERTGDMEKFVVSKEYKLRRDFNQMGEA